MINCSDCDLKFPCMQICGYSKLEILDKCKSCLWVTKIQHMFIFWMKSWNSYLKGLDNLLENGWNMYLKQRIKNWDSELKHCKVPIYQSVNEILGNIIKLTNDNRSLFFKLNRFLLDTCCKNEWKCLKNP